MYWKSFILTGAVLLEAGRVFVAIIEGNRIEVIRNRRRVPLGSIPEKYTKFDRSLTNQSKDLGVWTSSKPLRYREKRSIIHHSLIPPPTPISSSASDRWTERKTSPGQQKSNEIAHEKTNEDDVHLANEEVRVAASDSLAPMFHDLQPPTHLELSDECGCIRVPGGCQQRPRQLRGLSYGASRSEEDK